MILMSMMMKDMVDAHAENGHYRHDHDGLKDGGGSAKKYLGIFLNKLKYATNFQHPGTKRPGFVVNPWSWWSCGQEHIQGLPGGHDDADGDGDMHTMHCNVLGRVLLTVVMKTVPLMLMVMVIIIITIIDQD